MSGEIPTIDQMMARDPSLVPYVAMVRAIGALDDIANKLGNGDRFHRPLFLSEYRPPPAMLNPRRYVHTNERKATDGDRFFNPALNAIGNFRWFDYTIDRFKTEHWRCIANSAPESLSGEIQITLSMLGGILDTETNIKQAWTFLSDRSLEQSLRRAWTVRVIREAIDKANWICTPRLLEHCARLGAVRGEMKRRREALKSKMDCAAPDELPLMHEVRSAVRLLGMDAKRTTIRKQVGKRAEDVYAVLDFLKSTGDYTGPRD